MSQQKYPIFHTTNFPAGKCRSFYLPKQFRLPLTAGVPVGAVVAEPGDILLARVDRNLERKILTVAEGRAAISDTVFRMRVPANRRGMVSDFFHSNEGSALVDAVSRGVGAKLLSKRSLMSASLPIAAVLFDARSNV